MSSDTPVRLDVPAENDSVFANDGRVFVSLDNLIDTLAERIGPRTFAANLIKDPVAIAHSDAENMILDWLRDEREILSLENSIRD